MKSPNHIIVTGCIGPFYNEKLFINNNVTQKGSFCSRFFWPWNKFNAWLVLKWEQLLPSPVQILQGGVKHVLQMTSHGNICSLLSLQAGVHIWPWAPVHPSCLIPVCSCFQPQLEQAFLLSMGILSNLVPPGSTDTPGSSCGSPKAPHTSAVPCRCSWQILDGLEVLSLTEVFKHVLER